MKMANHMIYNHKKKSLLLGILCFLGFSLAAQEINVEFDKSRDLSGYKTFIFGASEIVTPKDQKQISDKTMDQWIKNAITRELNMKGLQKVDSAADLTVSYVAGTLARSDMGNLGPMGLTPGSTERTYIRDYQQGSLIIDLNDKRDFLIWRINSTSTMTPQTAERTIDQIVQKGFKQYGKTSKKKKK